MGIKISAIGRADPGNNGVPGDHFCNADLFKHLVKGLQFWKKVAFNLSPRSEKVIRKASAAIQRGTGIKSRNHFIGDTFFPNAAMSTAAALDTLSKLKSYDPSEIDGVIFVTDTQDSVFPLHGKVTLKLLGLKPRHYGNSNLACASIAGAIKQACGMFNEDESCNKVLIIASDITSRLHQKLSRTQPFLFGDQAVGMVLERTNGTGGFIVSNILLDPEAPDIYHKPVYSGESTIYTDVERKQIAKANDEALNVFGTYESRAIAAMIRIVNGDLGGNSKLFLPQGTKKVVENGVSAAGVEINGNVAINTVPEYSICGAASTPLAMCLENEQNPFTDDSFLLMMCGISGVHALVGFDPMATENIEMKYTIRADDIHAVRMESDDEPKDELPIVDSIVDETLSPGDFEYSTAEVVRMLHGHPNVDLIDVPYRRKVHKLTKADLVASV